MSVALDRPSFEIVRGLTVPPRDPKGTREGYTTGASAAAAAQAACRVLLLDERPELVAVHSPLGFDLMIRVNRLALAGEVATAGVIKDGGDDPDVTHGAEILAKVRRVEDAGIKILGGEGVGRITQPGLELPPGSPAINPVPLRMIAEGRGAGRRERPSFDWFRGDDLGPRWRGDRAEDVECPDWCPGRNLDPGDDRDCPADEHGELASVGRAVDRRGGGE